MKTNELGRRLGALPLSKLRKGQDIAFRINAMLPGHFHLDVNSTGDDLVRVGAATSRISKTAILSMDEAMDVINEIADHHRLDLDAKTTSFNTKKNGVMIFTGLMVLTTVGMIWNYVSTSAANGHGVDESTLKTLIEILKIFISLFTGTQ